MPGSIATEMKLERKGGTQSASFPHLCVYQVEGATKEVCSQLTRLFQRNRDGCCRTKCNSALRLCFKCVESGTNSPNQVKDPAVGLCEQHAAGASLALRQIDHTPQWLRTKLQEREVNVVPRSTEEECGRIALLSEGEQHVLFRLAYGFDPTYIDRELTKMATNVRSVADALPIIFRKLELEHIERERDRLAKAGRIYIDHNERRRETEGATILDPAVADAENDHIDEARDGSAQGTAVPRQGSTASFQQPVRKPAPPAASTIDTVDEDHEQEATVASAAAQAVPDRADTAQSDPSTTDPNTETTQMSESEELRDARKVAADYVEARANDQQLPHVTDVLTAAKTFSEAGMTKPVIGEQFGYEGASGATWATNILKLDGLSQAAWKALGANHVAYSFLFSICALPSVDQVAEIRQKLSKSDGRSVRSAERSERDAPEVRRPKATAARHEETPTNLPAASAPVAPAAVHANGNGSNGHTYELTSLLPVCFDLSGLGDFADIDLVAVKLGPEASAERIAAIAEQREHGYVPKTLAMHPAIPPQIIFVKPA